MYKHKNVKRGTVTIVDSKGKGYTLLPGESVEIDRRAVEAKKNGIVIETEKASPQKNKKIKVI